MRHNELFLNDDNEYVIRSQTAIGRYSTWSDHNDVRFSDVYNQKKFEFKPYKICFLVPLLKKDLFFLRTENESGIISEQFMYCSCSEKIEKLSFVRWALLFSLNFVLKSVTFWYVILSTLLNQKMATIPSLWTPLLIFLILRKFNKFYSFKKIMTFELYYWFLISLFLAAIGR